MERIPLTVSAVTLVRDRLSNGFPFFQTFLTEMHTSFLREGCLCKLDTITSLLISEMG